MVVSDAEVDHAEKKDRTLTVQVEYKEFLAVRDRIAEKWRAGTFDILQQKNPELLRRYDSLENQIDSLLVRADKSREFRKEWAAVVSEYEKTAMMAVAFAARHTQ